MIWRNSVSHLVTEQLESLQHSLANDFKICALTKAVKQKQTVGIEIFPRLLYRLSQISGTISILINILFKMTKEFVKNT